MRLIIVVLIMLSGSGVIIYLIAWIIMSTAALLSADDILGQLHKLGELKKDGLLTEAEFQTQERKSSLVDRPLAFRRVRGRDDFRSASVPRSLR